MIKNKRGENFRLGLFVIAISIVISALAFLTSSNITSFVTSDTDTSTYTTNYLKEFTYVDSLSTLAPGNYYIDGDGIVYWLDDDSAPAIAKVTVVYESQKNRQIYVDKEGDISYQ
ncbi:hypothetical protein HYW99_03435 [Candidatus Woesearchaeota archaeon]|nr:hypothetical protein [Candidatus Woesearchaeota archaeon]